MSDRPTTGAHLRHGTAGAGPYALEITPESAGWGCSGLRVLELAPGGTHALATGDDEVIVLPLAGGCTVAVDGETLRPRGPRRASSRRSPTSLYVPRDARVEIASDGGGRFALTSARADRRLEPRHVPADQIAVELRGAGQASRQVNNFCAPEAFAADRLIAVEVLTPAGNWSSYPPHKHDEEVPGVETALEEIYYFEVAPSPAGDRLRLPARLRLRARARDRRDRRGAQRRRDRHAARLPRPVDGRARLRPLLPQRDGRAGRARVALHRRPRPRLDPGDLGGPGRSTRGCR